MERSYQILLKVYLQLVVVQEALLQKATLDKACNLPIGEGFHLKLAPL